MPDTNISLPEDSLKDTHYILGLILLPLFWFFPYWLYPMGVGDNIVEFQPHFGYILGTIRSFQDPLWNPFLLSGFPISGYPSASVYDIFTWLYLFLPVNVAGNVQTLLMYSVAGVGFYFFGRAMGLTRPGSFLAGVIYSAGTYGLSSFASILAYGGFVWGGWILAALEKLRQARGLRSRSGWTFLLAITLGLQLMAGHPHNFQHTCIFAGIYVLFVGLVHERGKSRWAWMGCSLAALILALGLAQAIILPGMELQQLSWRKELPYEMFMGVSYDLHEMLGGIILPGIFPKYLRIPYLGVVFCSLAGYGVLKNIRDSRYKALVLITIFSMIMMLGDNTPLPKLLYQIPGLDLVGSSNRYRTEFAYVVAILAGAGLDYLLKNEVSSWLKWIIALSGVTAVGIAASLIGGELTYKHILVEIITASLIMLFIYLRVVSRKSRWLPGALAVFLIIPNFYVGSYLAFPEGRVNPAGTPAILKHVPNQKGHNRPPSRMLPVVDITKSGMALIHKIGAQNFSELHGIHNAAGYLPLISKRYKDLMNMDFIGFPGRLRELLEKPAIIPEILNIQYIIIPKRYIMNNFSRLFTFPEPTEVGDTTFLEELYIELKSEDEYYFQFPDKTANGIALVTTLANSSNVPQGKEVLSVFLGSDENSTKEITLKAGIDTAEARYGNIGRKEELTLKVGEIPFYYDYDTVIYPGQDMSLHFYGYEAEGLAMVSYLFIARNVPQGQKVAEIKVVTKNSGNLTFPVRAGIESSEWSIEYKSGEVLHRKTKVAENFRDQRGVIGHKYFCSFQFDKPVKVKSVEISVGSNEQKAGLNLNHLAIIGTKGGYKEGMLPHKVASIFPKKSTQDDIRDAYHLYYTIKKFDKPIKVDSCKFRCLLESRNSVISIRAMTMLQPSSEKDFTLSYIHHMLGQTELYERIDTPEAYIWRKKSPSPRAWLTSRALWLKPDKILESLKTGTLPNGEKFNPYRTALLEREEDKPFFPLSGGNLRGGAEITRYSANEIHLSASCSRTCLLVLSEKYYPGWKAYVDGEKKPVYKTDYVLRGVSLAPGDHDVIFKYQPVTVKYGRIISLSTLLLIIISWIGIRKFTSKKTDSA